MHKAQFAAMQLPPSLAPVVYGKLLSHSFDARKLSGGVR